MLQDKESCEEIKIAFGGREINATLFRAGKRTPFVVFSHGFNGWKGDFEATARYLNEYGIGAVTFTFCGSGARDPSGFATTDMTLFTERDELLAVIEYVKNLSCFNGELYLFGASQGGMITAMAAQARADCLKGLMLLFPAFCIPDDQNARFPSEEIPERVEQWGVQLGRNFFLTAKKIDIFAKMDEFQKPVLLFHGTEDRVVPISYSERAARRYPNATLIPYEGEGHGFSQRAIDDVNRRILQFVKRS